MSEMYTVPSSQRTYIKEGLYAPTHYSTIKADMHFANVLLAIVANSFLTSIALGLSLREQCGGDLASAKITKIPYMDKVLTVTETVCPGFETLRNRTASSSQLGARANVNMKQKRQVDQCTSGGCTVYCEDLGEQPFPGDCQDLTDALEALYPEMFPVAAGTMQSFDLGYTCAYGFGNLDTYDYDVCYLSFGYIGAITANDCFGSWPAAGITPGGICLSPGEPTDDWGVEVYYP
ncbi:hypothetical protein BJ138DRAFT_56441 [Hygrophoropsis aurantiaca]|uniref:Uncharacterized protein n=1 Tax=Hygrophoropsis aurantiaca TaxID=72124 RepID=A0ACB8ARG6_9AGAM|nr:hypothetical protein BJ138DRAFT_56441 [Hygrophoropsis aurantiaca]